MSLPLFSSDGLPDPPSPSPAAQSMPAGKPRLRLPIRDQIEMRSASLDDLLEADHPVRAVWVSVCGLDLKSWLGEIKAVDGHVGRDATDPRLLVALWVFATLKAVGSAREIARLCRESLPYQWLCGGVSINYHMLSDFRSSGGEKWDELLTQIVATLLDAGLVNMERIAQDGMRVRASAGKSSFHRRATLEECLEAAKEQVETLKQLSEEDTAELTRRQLAARATAMPLQSGGVEWGPRPRSWCTSCEAKRRSGSTLRPATAASGSCPCAANRDVVQSHYCLQLLITWWLRRDCAQRTANRTI